MQNDLTDLVKQRIENLRPKLLDLSRRNPLIATKLGPRSNSHIRVVDELPDILFHKLNNREEMRLAPLPAIDDDPRDEQTREFRDALINARLTDVQYRSEMESVDRDADDYIDRTRQIERSLKDRIREALGLPPRPTDSSINLIQHAKNNGIAPSYELPRPDPERTEDRHSDDSIQTLLLPGDFERKLNAIASKCRTWTQETGINVLHVAYGFLEWSERDQAETAFSPLILCEAKIEKRRTQHGVAFSISGIGEDAAVNAVFAEKLRQDFGVELPAFTGSSVEDYLAQVSDLSPRNLTWRVRRQVAIGVFPSARMAMYHDLDPERPDFPDSEIVKSLLGGTDAGSDLPYADEYEVDRPDMEAKVPCLVMAADSSQFSALVDMADGKNVAVEGPPGTGKSQTIVNAIGAALADGKKVLFVAEKLAALNVVKARLEAIGLGDFLLPLQAERSTREQVIASVRKRMEMRRDAAIRDYEDKLAEYRRTRHELAKYIDLMARPFEESGLTVREILGKSIATCGCLAGVPPEVLEKCEAPPSCLTRSGLEQLRRVGAGVEEAHRAIAGSRSPWKETTLLHPDRFTIEQACDLAGRAGRTFSRLADSRDSLADVGLAAEAGETLSQIDAQLEAAQAHVQVHGADLVLALMDDRNAAAARHFIERCEAYQRERAAIAGVVAAQLDDDCIALIGNAATICERNGLGTIDPGSLGEELEQRRETLRTIRSVLTVLAPLVGRRPESRTWRLCDMAKASALLDEAGDEAMLCRNAWTREPAATHLLSRLCANGRKLQEQKSALADRVSFAVEATIEALGGCVSALRAAGALRMFSLRYHRAKRRFLSISRLPGYDRRTAVDTLDALIGFRGQEAAFNAHPHVAAAFGFHFRGADTEFEPFERLARYYAQV